MARAGGELRLGLTTHEKVVALMGFVALAQGAIQLSDPGSQFHVLLAIALGTVGGGLLGWTARCWLRRRADPALGTATLQDVRRWTTSSRCPTCDGPVRGEHRTYVNGERSEARQVFVCVPSDGEHFEGSREPG